MKALRIKRRKSFFPICATMLVLQPLAHAGGQNLSSGKYWSFIDGSKEHYSKSADPVGASLKIGYSDATDYLDVSSFDIVIDMQNGPTKSIRISPIVADDATIIDDHTVLLSMTANEGLIGISDNGVLENSLERIEIKVTDKGSSKKFIDCDTNHYADGNGILRTDYNGTGEYQETYRVEITLFNNTNVNEADGHHMGSFKGELKFVDRIPYIGSCSDTSRIHPDTDSGKASGKGLYKWIKKAASEKLKKDAIRTWIEGVK